MAHRTSTRSRDERLKVRVSHEQKALFKQAAELQGRTLTDFIIASVHDAAARTIEEMQAIHLAAKESQAFADALLKPCNPNAKLKAAARRYIEIQGD